MKKTSLTLALLSSVTTQSLFAEELAPIVVTPNNLQQPENTVTSITHVITREDIDENGWDTVAEALNSLPDISISNSGGLGKATNVYLRGQNGNGILFLIDGEIIADAAGTTLAPQIENLLLDNVERIEVVEGPQSGVWGANASGGVINIITRKAGHNSFSFTTGSNNLRKVDAFVSKKDKKLALSAHLSSLSTEGYSALKPYKGSDSGLEKDGFNQESLGFKARVNLAEHHALEIRLDKTNSATDFDNISPYDPNSTADRNERTFTHKSIGYGFQNGPLNIKLNASEYITDRTSYSASGSYPYKSNLTEHRGQITYQYQPRNTIQLAAGNQRIQGNKDAYWHDYAGVTHVHHFGKLNLTEALRHDHYDRFKDATTGKVGFKYPLSKNLTIQGNYGTGYNAPSAFQVGYGQTQNLKPESTEGWDAAVQWKKLSISYFDQKVKDSIQYGGTWPNYYCYNAIGTSTFKGWALNYANRVNNLDIRFNYSWLEARNAQKQLLARRPLQKGVLGLNYLGFDRFRIGTLITHIGDYYDTNGTSGANLGNYTLVDLTADYILNRHFTLFLKGINIFDQDYYLAADQKNPPDYGYNTGGFQWRIGLRGKF